MSKKVLIIGLILILIISGTVTIVLTGKTDNEKNMDVEEQVGDVETKFKREKVSNSTVFYTVEDCINFYIDSVKAEEKDKIFELLDEKYINENNINQENVLKYVEKPKNSFIALDMYESELNNVCSYIVEGVENDGIYNTKMYFRVGLDTNNFSFNIMPLSAKKYNSIDEIEENENIAGHGISAKIDGKHVLAGNAKLMSEHGVEHDYVTSAGTVCYLAVDEKYIGNIIISDVVKPEAKEAIDSLRENGVSNIVMLTGDRKEAGEKVAAELGLDKAYTDLLPGDKVTKVEELLAHEHNNEKLAFVGDGINDTPVIARSDVGFAMGAIGSDAAIEAADIVIMDDDIRKISIIKRIAKFTLSVVTQNIVFALVIKVAILILSAIGFANMWIAVFADVGVAMICILNSFRALYKK